MIRGLLAFAAFAFFTSAIAAQEDQPVEIVRDVSFLGPDRAPKLDLYLPAKGKAGELHPAVLIVHGGGWHGGDKAAAREKNIGTTLAGAGYVCASVNYVLAKKTEKFTDNLRQVWPRNLQDCMTGVRFLRANAEKYHIDPDRIGAIGGSAGGHLVAMLAAASDSDGLDPEGPFGEFSCRVQAAVPMYGAHDLEALAETRDLWDAMTADDRDLCRRGSPVTYLTNDDPPLLIPHGTKDHLVPVSQSEILHESAKKAGLESRLHIIEDAPHSFHLQPKQQDLRPLVIGFFDQHLKKEGASASSSAYQWDPDFPKLPAGMELGAASGVEIGPLGNIHIFHRGKKPILVFTPEGKFLRSFGDGLYDSTHFIRRDREGNLWTADNRNHTVVKLSGAGKVLRTFGERDVPGLDARHFNKPADMAFAADGSFFIADGYGNSRIAKFNRSGKFLFDWGRKGTGDGEFDLPHAIDLDSKGKVYVGDRENDRIQVFDQEGKYLRQFGGFAPFGIFITPDDVLWVADGRANRVMKMSLDGKVLDSWGSKGSGPGQFQLPHGIVVDEAGAVYVAEIDGKRVQKFALKEGL